MGVYFVADSVQCGQQAVFDFRREVFVGEVDQGFLEGKNITQAVRPVAVERAEFAFHLAQSLALLGLRFCGDQVVDGLGFHQVHAIVEERAAGEFTRFGRAEAGLGQGIRNTVYHRSAAVQVQFGAVLASIGIGAGEP